MAMTLESLHPKRENPGEDLNIDIDQHDNGFIIMKQEDDWIAVPKEDLPELIAALQRVAELVLK